jgi:hypothetical protein
VITQYKLSLDQPQAHQANPPLHTSKQNMHAPNPPSKNTHLQHTKYHTAKWSALQSEHLT